MSWTESTAAIRTFVEARDWAQFHSPDALARSVSIEAGELLECYQWSADADPAAVRAELADVLIYALLLADRLEVDVDAIIADKLLTNAHNYPIERSRGNATKHDRL